MKARWWTAALLLLLAAAARAKHSGEPVDVSKGVPLVSRIPCDGFTAPEEHLYLKATFSSGGAGKRFVVETYMKDGCRAMVGDKCLKKEPAAWREAWVADSAAPDENNALGLRSCYEWGAHEPAQYVLTGWYKESADKKAPWMQVPLKRAAGESEVYEFSDVSGGTARLEIKR